MLAWKRLPKGGNPMDEILIVGARHGVEVPGSRHRTARIAQSRVVTGTDQ